MKSFYMGDHATLLITDISRILVPYNINSLKKEVKRIYDRKMFSALDMRFDDIEKLSLHDQVRELFRVYHLAYPNLDIDHDTYMGLYKNNAVYLSTYTPPLDFYEIAIVISNKTFQDILSSHKRIRTKILNENRECIGMIIRSDLLEKITTNDEIPNTFVKSD